MYIYILLKRVHVFIDFLLFSFKQFIFHISSPI